MATFTYVSAAEAHDFSFSSTTSLGVAYAQNVASGDLLIVFAEMSAGSFNISDNLNGGQTWHQLGTTLTGGYGVLAVWWAVANAAGACTVTITKQGGGTMSNLAVQVLEWHNNTASPFDQTTSNGSANSVNVTANSTNEVVLGFAIPQGGATFGPSAGWTQTSANFGAIYTIETLPGIFTPSVSPGFGTCGIIAASFKSTSSTSIAKPAIIIIQ